MSSPRAGEARHRLATRPFLGVWQSLRIWFQAPQYDSAAKLMAKPKILRVLLNGVAVQENFTLPGPTLSHLNIQPAATNPIMLQGDHGPVAFRNIYIKLLSKETEVRSQKSEANPR